MDGHYISTSQRQKRSGRSESRQSDRVASIVLERLSVNLGAAPRCPRGQKAREHWLMRLKIRLYRPGIVSSLEPFDLDEILREGCQKGVFAIESR